MRWLVLVSDYFINNRSCGNGGSFNYIELHHERAQAAALLFAAILYSSSLPATNAQNFTSDIYTLSNPLQLTIGLLAPNATPSSGDVGLPDDQHSKLYSEHSQQLQHRRQYVEHAHAAFAYLVEEHCTIVGDVYQQEERECIFGEMK